MCLCKVVAACIISKIEHGVATKAGTVFVLISHIIVIKLWLGTDAHSVTEFKSNDKIPNLLQFLKCPLEAGFKRGLFTIIPAISGQRRVHSVLFPINDMF